VSFFKESYLLLFAILASIVCLINIVDITLFLFWSNTDFDWVYLGKKLVFALVTGYAAWQLLVIRSKQKR